MHPYCTWNCWCICHWYTHVCECMWISMCANATHLPHAHTQTFTRAYSVKCTWLLHSLSMSIQAHLEIHSHVPLTCAHIPFTLFPEHTCATLIHTPFHVHSDMNTHAHPDFCLLYTHSYVYTCAHPGMFSHMCTPNMVLLYLHTRTPRQTWLSHIAHSTTCAHCPQTISCIDPGEG